MNTEPLSRPLMAAPTHPSTQAFSSNLDSSWRPQDLIKAQELSQRLCLAEGTVYQLARSGRIPSIRIGGRLRFDWNEVRSRCELLEIDPANPNKQLRLKSTRSYRKRSSLSVPGTAHLPPPAFAESGVEKTKDRHASTQEERSKLKPGRKSSRYAALSPTNLSHSEITAALQLCAGLNLIPHVISGDDLFHRLPCPTGVHLIFVTPEHLQEGGDSATLEELMELALDREGGILAVLIRDTANLRFLDQLPAGMPVMLCPMDSLENTHRALSTALMKLPSNLHGSNPIKPQYARQYAER